MSFKMGTLFRVYSSINRVDGCLAQYTTEIPIDKGLVVGRRLNEREFFLDLNTIKTYSVIAGSDNEMRSIKDLQANLKRDGFARTWDRRLILEDPYVVDVFNPYTLGLVKLA
jgi:hypothetical protein